MLTLLDWLIILAYLLLSLGIGLYYTRRAGSSLQEFFLSGRSMPWYLAGLSMVATTFAADTPLAVTELTRSKGIAGNWLWWNMLLGGMLTTFFFARLWRRAEILTDLELISIRYSGRIAHVLRGFRAVYQGFFLNAIILAWINLALMSILQVYFQLTAPQALWVVAGAMALTTLYAALAGLRGVILTDAVQFFLAMTGCIVLAVVVISSPQIGGLQGLVRQLPPEQLSFLPALGGAGSGKLFALGLGSFFAFAGVQWWASWYPGAEPGGGGYVAQRMMSAKNEGHSLAATLFFQLMYYALRPWPWILVALASAVLYPALAPADYRLGFVYAMRDFLPQGLQGLLLVAFFAAYMSSLSSQLNWGSSYLLNDLYRTYLRPEASNRHYIIASRLITGLLMLGSLAITTQLQSISGAWSFILEAGAGVGLVLILRWYWWRISAWSELVATVLPFICFGIFKALFWWVDGGAASSFWQFPSTFFLTVGITTCGWLAATYLLPGTDAAQLQRFYNRIQPQGAWGPFATVPATATAPLKVLAACWALAVVGVYSLLFAIGDVLFGHYLPALVLTLLTLTSGACLYWLCRRYAVFGGS